MKKFSLFTLVMALLVVWECSTVPITGRKQLSLIPQSEMLAMSFTQYDEFLKSNKLSTDKNNTQLVKRVGSNIQNAVETFFSQNEMGSYLQDFRWEFNLVESEEVNAWCMPGGKVVVYSGILPVTQNEAGLAVVMGHEIGHAIAEHGNERMSQQLLYQMGGMALATALQNKPELTQSLWMAAFGLGTQVGILLPFSRTQENEADELGLIFMAMAGYDPNEAVTFWQRMSAGKGGSPPEFLSTHPSDETRINNLKNLVPEAMKYYTKR